MINRYCIFSIKILSLISIFQYEISLAATNTDENSVQILMIGDSTMANYSSDQKSILTGWGEALENSVNDDNNIIIYNHARPGTSSKSFITRGFWETAKKINADYLFIQFGTNDSSGKGDRSTNAETDFKDYLNTYIDESRALGLKPILITPASRRNFRNGKVYTILEPYAKAMIEVGFSKNAPVIDLHYETVRLFNALGKDISNNIFSSDGIERTHYSEQGANYIVKLIINLLHSKDPELYFIINNNLKNKQCK